MVGRVGGQYQAALTVLDMFIFTGKLAYMYTMKCLKLWEIWLAFKEICAFCLSAMTVTLYCSTEVMGRLQPPAMKTQERQSTVVLWFHKTHQVWDLWTLCTVHGGLDTD